MILLPETVPYEQRVQLELIRAALYSGQKSRAKTRAQAAFVELLRLLAEAHP